MDKYGRLALAFKESAGDNVLHLLRIWQVNLTALTFSLKTVEIDQCLPAKLIERALAQSGIEQGCKHTWSAMPNFNSCLTAHTHDRNGQRTGYFRPNHLDGLTAVHMRLSFEHPVEGPMAVGAGRHCGFGLFAVFSE